VDASASLNDIMRYKIEGIKEVWYILIEIH
jgi:hypothetical protein